MHPAGLEAFARRRQERSGVYSHEQAGEPQLAAEHEALFRERSEAWAYFRAQPPSYRKAAIWWIVNAKRPETRARRLATLIDDSAAERWVRHLQRPGRR